MKRLPVGGLKDHKDPFDRFLVLQAIQNSWTLITDDSRIAHYKKFGLHVVVG